ncbi:MAG: ABC-F family ATP-binding cassette domain-containing protein [Kineosporiaceae bacterium]
MIVVSDVEMWAGPRLLVSGAGLRVGAGDRVGLVGRNGAGKTTLLKVMTGQVLPAAGSVRRTGSVGYLPQDPRTGDLETPARDRILAARGLDAALARMRKAEVDMIGAPEDATEAAMRRYAAAEAEFTAAGGWAAESEAARIAANLSLPERVLDQPLRTLSGGQRRRVELARIIFSGADVLLLDEPTNHLDADSIVWLRDRLRSWPGGFVVISHDEGLLDATVTSVAHLDATRSVLEVHSLGWTAYLKQREVDEKRRRRERANAEKKASALRAQADKMKATATKATAAQNMARRADRLVAGLAEQRQADKVAALRFPEPAPCGRVPLTAEGLSKSYGSLEVFAGVDLAVDKGSRVVVLGLNGAGKTTLLRVLAGVERPDTGRVVPGHGLRLGYYAQEHETLDPGRTVLETMRSAAPDLDDTAVRTVLGSFLFSGDDVAKPVEVLSGGERTRLALATLVVSGANVLLLDEPTNNLDPASREQVLSALGRYSGAVVLVTHDEGAVLALDPGRVVLLPEGDEDLWSQEYADLVSLA